MKEEDYWERFMTTGKVEDFLAYRNGMEYEAENAMSSMADKEEGESSDAGICRSDRDGVEG